MSRNRERGQESGARNGHMAFLSTSKTVSLLKISVLFLLHELLWSFFIVNVHGVGVMSRRVSGRNWGIKGYWGVGGVLFCY